MDGPGAHAPWGYDVFTHTEVVPKPAPITWHWRVGPVTDKSTDLQLEPSPTGPAPTERQLTVQLTADQQVALSITGQDRYGNPVNITGGTAWSTSDEAIVALLNITEDSCTAVAVGPTGSAAVTVTNDVNADGTGDFIGSISIDVVAGVMADIEVAAAAPEDKPVVEPR